MRVVVTLIERPLHALRAEAHREQEIAVEVPRTAAAATALTARCLRVVCLGQRDAHDDARAPTRTGAVVGAAGVMCMAQGAS